MATAMVLMNGEVTWFQVFPPPSATMKWVWREWHTASSVRCLLFGWVRSAHNESAFQSLFKRFLSLIVSIVPSQFFTTATLIVTNIPKHPFVYSRPANRHYNLSTCNLREKESHRQTVNDYKNECIIVQSHYFSLIFLLWFSAQWHSSKSPFSTI